MYERCRNDELKWAADVEVVIALGNLRGVEVFECCVPGSYVSFLFRSDLRQVAVEVCIEPRFGEFGLRKVG